MVTPGAGYGQPCAPPLAAAVVTGQLSAQVGVGGLGGQEAYPRVYHVRAIGAGDDRIEVELRHLGRSSASRETRCSGLAARPGRRAGRRGGRAVAGRRGWSGSGRWLSVSVSGVSRADRSPSTSVATPPRPKATSGPKTGSCTTPMMTSVPPVTMGWTTAADMPVAEPFRQRPVARPHLILAVQVELDRSGVGLVHQPGHVGLQHHRDGQLSRQHRPQLARRREPGKGDLVIP